MDFYAEQMSNFSGLRPEHWDHLPSLLGGNIAKWKLNACIGRQYDDVLAARACLDGYKQAAQLMVAYIKANNFNQDTLVYPFAYCWRHYVELAIKTIAYEAGGITDLRGHSLAKLWEHTRPFFISTSRHLDAENLTTIDSIIHLLNEIDPSGQTFRYARSSKGERHLASETLLNIDDFNLVLCSLAEVLDDCIWHIDRSKS